MSWNEYESLKTSMFANLCFLSVLGGKLQVAVLSQTGILGFGTISLVYTFDRRCMSYSSWDRQSENRVATAMTLKNRVV